jgi:hypothetical protein
MRGLGEKKGKWEAGGRKRIGSGGGGGEGFSYSLFPVARIKVSATIFLEAGNRTGKESQQHGEVLRGKPGMGELYQLCREVLAALRNA